VKRFIAKQTQTFPFHPHKTTGSQRRVGKERGKGELRNVPV